MDDQRQHFVNGEWRDSIDGTPFGVIDPATEEVVAEITLGGPQDVERAVQAAAEAAQAWSQTTVDERADILAAAIETYSARAEEFAWAMTTEMGTPITFSREMQTPCGDGSLQATLDALRSHEFERPTPRGGSLLLDEPVGVCALITPWNWPVNQVAVKVAPALAAGCTMVLKPSEYSPLSAHLFADILAEAGVPPGVFNLVDGDGLGVGASLVDHPKVDMVSFTGSTRAGVAIAQSAAMSVKRVTLELGGKSPNLVFADADLDTAIPWSVNNCFSNTGQTCDAPTRMLVEREVYDEVVERVIAAAQAETVGDPKVEGPHIGPLVNGRQFERVQDMIVMGEGEDNRLVVGGTGRPDGLDRGYYVRPTVFADVTNDQKIAQQEVFGPVLSVMAFDTEGDAVAIANDTPYGLAAFIQSGDGERIQRLARRLRAGQINVNGAAADFDAPFGGYKQSGNGREQGHLGLEDYLETKVITV